MVPSTLPAADNMRIQRLGADLGGFFLSRGVSLAHRGGPGQLIPSRTLSNRQ